MPDQITSTRDRRPADAGSEGLGGDTKGLPYQPASLDEPGDSTRQICNVRLLWIPDAVCAFRMTGNHALSDEKDTDDWIVSLGALLSAAIRRCRPDYTLINKYTLLDTQVGRPPISLQRDFSSLYNMYCELGEYVVSYRDHYDYTVSKLSREMAAWIVSTECATNANDLLSILLNTYRVPATTPLQESDFRTLQSTLNDLYSNSRIYAVPCFGPFYSAFMNPPNRRLGQTLAPAE